MKNLNQIENVLREIELLYAANGTVIFVNGPSPDRPFEDIPTHELVQGLDFYRDELAVRGLHLGQGRQSAPTDFGVVPYGDAARIGAGPAGDWVSFGDFAAAVRGANGPKIDPRLIKNAPTTYGTEGVGADGGFAVPPEYSAMIWQKVPGVVHLIDRCAQQKTPSNQFVLPADETAPWDTTRGPQAEWMGEGQQMTESKPSLESKTIRLNKLGVLVPVTEELVEDAPSLDGYLRRVAPGKIHARLNTAIIDGTGAGQPLGLLNSGSLVSVAKESAQSADTVVYQNIVNMFSRLHAGCIGNSAWFINQDILPQLMQMEFPSANNGTFPAWMPPGMLADAPHGLLLGRPVVPLESCKTLGDKGDIIFADLSQFLCILKASGLRTDVSMHLYFDYDMLAYRFLFRVSGMPLWKSAITPENGTNDLSWAVSLDERS